jgi:hypothetical protein
LDVLKRIAIVLLAVGLLILPLAARWLYYYEGRYQPGQVPRPDLAQISEPESEVVPFADQYVALSPGVVLVDMAHDNHVEMAELNVLQARLTARNQRLEPVTEPGDLPGQLRHARALVVISPGLDWMPDEVRLVQEFVDKGGRLLLVTDPSRFGILYNEWGEYAGVDPDAAHANSLAARFGLLFQADYLYNTAENAGNFRNVKLGTFSPDDLVQGLGQVVFYAAHSIVTEEPALVVASGDTQSSAGERNGELTVATLAADGAVVGLGDFTFMTEPHNSVYDNDRLIANIADWLSGGQRRYELADFPFFFDGPVDLVYAGDPLLNDSLLQGGSSLQRLFADEGLDLTVREADGDTRDTLFLGLYHKAGEVEPYLEAAQVTLHITSTEALKADEEEDATAEPGATSSPVNETGAFDTESAAPDLEIEEPSAQDRIEVASVGEMVITGTSLLLLQTEGERQTLVVLADNEVGLDSALVRLTEGNLDGCLLHRLAEGGQDLLALCPTGEIALGDEGGWQEPEGPPIDQEPSQEPGPEPSAPGGELEGEVLIVALDEGDARYEGRTGAEDYAAILEGRYGVTVSSVVADGWPDSTTLLAYDLVILTAGDYEQGLGDQGSELFLDLLLEGTPILLSGAYVGESETQSVQRDIQVEDATHPLADGFESGEVIPFIIEPPAESYEVDVLDDPGESGEVVVFVRGPDSEDSGGASLIALEDEFSDVRVVLVGFPIHLLPEEAKTHLVLNATTWLLNP